jgi:hypothetical protein
VLSRSWSRLFAVVHGHGRSQQSLKSAILVVIGLARLLTEAAARAFTGDSHGQPGSLVAGRGNTRSRILLLVLWLLIQALRS